MNLKELADKLNLSPSTVSRVLNDKPGISEKTRRMVLEAVRDTGFQQNFSASNLASPRARFIGVLSRRRGGQQDQLYFHHSIERFEEFFLKQGFQCISLGLFDDEHATLNDILRGSPLGAKDFAGVIIRGQSIPARTILSFRQAGIPVVLLENRLQETPLDSVVCEDRDTSYRLTKLLIDKGYSDIVHITGPEEWYNNRERMDGYIAAVSEAGKTPRIIALSETTVETGEEAFEAVRGKHAYPLGVVAVNDAMAIGFSKAARDGGVAIPGEMGITGFDDIPWAEHNYPPLTSAKVHIEEMGRLAAARLIQLMDEPDSHPVTIRVPADIIERKTT
jgi:LacI family transcriptional regulator